MRTDDESYFRARAIEEQVAAQNAASGAARKSHGQLAMIYRFRAAILSGGPPEWAGALREDALAETV